MNKLVNFEDNLYLLLVRIKMTRDFLSLSPDPALFLRKTLDDIEFIDSSLESILGELLDKQQLIERDGLLNHLSEIELHFGRVLSELLQSEKLTTTAEFPQINEKLMAISGRSHERQKEAEKSGYFSSTSDNKIEINGKSNELVVSSVELNELFKSL